MSEQEPVVLTCIDGSSVTPYVCDYAAWIANKAGAPLKLLHTIEHHQVPPVSDLSGAIGLGSREELLMELTAIEQSRSKLMIEKGQLMLKGAKERVQANGIASPELCQRHGALVESLIELESKTRVLVVGIRGESHESMQAGIGTQLESVIRAMHKPILVVNTEFKEPKRVMLAYDGGPACKKALDMVINSPLFQDVDCHVVHVGTEGEKLLNEAESQLKDAGIQTSSAQIQGKIHEALATYQEQNDIDLMLMGAFSHNRIRDFLVGSFTEKMLDRSQRPLLLLR